MRQYTVGLTAAGLAGMLFLAACGRDNKPEEARDVSLPPPPTTQPQLQDVPAPARTPTTTRPNATTSRTTPRTTPPAQTQSPPSATANPPAAPPVTSTSGGTVAAYGTIASGTEFALRSPARICTNTHKVGDRIIATVAESVNGTNGVSIPAGATATLQVSESVPGENDKSKVKLDFTIVSVSFGGQTYSVAGADVTAPVNAERRQSTADQAKKVAAGAAIGAVIGQVIGKNTKSTVVGGAIGAAGGAAAAAGTADYDGCVAADARIAVRLAQPLRIRATE
jgi:hypothetical protein